MIQPIKRSLQATTYRLRLQKTFSLTFYALNTGLLFTLLLILLGRFFPIAMPIVLLSAGLTVTAFSLLATLGYIWIRPYQPITVARLIDNHLKLDERLATSLELAANNHNSPPAIIQAQLNDTLQHLEKFNLSRAFPIQWSWRLSAIAGLLIIAVVVGIVIPNPQVEIILKQAQDEEIIATQKDKFEEIKAELLADKALMETTQGQEMLQTMDELIATLKENNITPQEALAAISKAEQKLAALQNETALQQKESLNSAAEALSQFDSTADLAEALSQQDFAKASEMLNSAANNNNPQKAQEMAQALRQAAQAAQQAGNRKLADALNQAADALQQQAAGQQNGNSQEALQQAAKVMAAAGGQTANQKAIEQALANIQKAREQLAAQAGQGQAGQGQAGQGQAGQGQAGQGQAGQGQAGQGQAGQGQGGSGREEPGPGADGLISEQNAPGSMSTDNGPNKNLTGQYESIYAPDHLGGTGGPIVNPDQQGAEGGIPIDETMVDPNQNQGTALTPYNEVYSQYADTASNALEDSYIPSGMKGYIRHYFGKLEPEQ